MRIKIKVTYSDYSGIIKASIFYINGWYELQSSLSLNSINEMGVLKIEKVIEADEANTIDTTLKS